MKRLESILLCIVIAGVILYITGVTGGSELLMIAGLLLSMLYFVPRFFINHDLEWRKGFTERTALKENKILFITSFAGITLSILTLAFVFGIHLWAGGFFFGLFGLFFAIICSILSLFFLKKEKTLLRKILLRILPFLIVVSVLFFSPAEIKVRLLIHDPVIRSFQLHILENPYDEKARMELKEYMEAKEKND